MCVPASVLEEAGMRLGQAVDVREEGGRIVIEPLWAARYDIDALVAEITHKNCHGPAETGGRVGQEVW